jgi:hypothetical protein
MSLSRPLRVLCGAAVLASALPSQAASVNIQAFQPSPFGRDILSVRTGAVGAPGAMMVAALNLHYTRNPLIFQGVDPFNRTALEETVTDRLMAELLFAYAPLEWLDLGLVLPLVLMSQSGERNLEFSGVGDTTGFSTGEMRLLLRCQLFDLEGFRMAAEAALTFPTASNPDSLAANGFGGGATVVLDYRIDRFLVALNGGIYLREEGQIGNQIAVSHELALGLGGSLDLIQELGLVGEAYTRTQLQDPFGNPNLIQFEAMGGVRIRPLEELSITVGGGGGTPAVQGYGTSQLRFFVDLKYLPSVGSDGDSDGVLDADDQCGFLPEDVDAFHDEDGCPDPDNDEDTILDVDEACDNEPEDADGFEDEDGCPDRDDDGDAVDDHDDQCPRVAEDKDGFEDQDGCPDEDNDRDGLKDPDDQCPLDAETPNGFQDLDGCADYPGISVLKDRVELAQPIRFTKTGAIAPESLSDLRTLATLVGLQSTWKRLKVVSHAGPSKGLEAPIEAATLARAQAIVNELVVEGVPIARLQAVGMGVRAPLPVAGKPGEKRPVERIELLIERD